MSQPAYDAELLDSYESYGSEGADDNTTLEIDEVVVARTRVEQTRAEMADTIEALKEKLEPQHLVDQAKETVREATIGKAQHVMDEAKDRAREAVDTVSYTARDYSTTIVDTIRANPIPAAMIGIGVGWLLMSARKQNNGYRRYEADRYYGPTGSTQGYGTSAYGTPVYGASVYGAPAYGTPDYQTTDRYENPAAGTYGTYDRSGDQGGLRDMAGRVQERAGEVVDRVQDSAGRIADRAGEMAERVQDRAGELAGRVQDRAGRVVDRAGEVASRVQDRAGQMAGRVQESAAQVSERARYQARQAATVVQQNVEENPLAVGAVALAVGAALGFLLPETQKEHELMGEARDRIMDRAQTTAQQVGQKVQNVAREAVDTMKTQAQDQGLMPNKDEMNNLKQKASNIIDTTMHAAEQEAQSQGLIPGDQNPDLTQRRAA
jgi:ElaB/YqjD/DUF883 family membrane-anchored ribosome-binding protein